MNTGQITLILIDNHPMLREGLALILNNQVDMQVVAEGSDGRDAIELHHRHRPAVTVIDLRMPGMNGTVATAAILEADPAARILILTTFDGDQDIQRAMRAGARGYVLKDQPREEVLFAIRSVHRGQRYVSPSVGGKLVDALSAPPLTQRENDVLLHLGKGKANKQIAHHLGISEGTVKTHVNAIRTKLGVSSRTEAALAAVRNGLLA